MIGSLNDPHTRIFSPEEKFDWWRPRVLTTGLIVREIEGLPTVVQVETELRASSRRYSRWRCDQKRERRSCGISDSISVSLLARRVHVRLRIPLLEGASIQLRSRFAGKEKMESNALADSIDIGNSANWA